MTRWGRVARGTVAAFASVFFAAFAHSLAGGALPGLAGIALVFIFSVLVGIAFTGQRMQRARLAASILASQAMYHWLFGSLGTLEIAASPAAGPVAHVHNAPIDFGSLAAAPHDHGDMFWAHVAAAILTFGAIAFGERTIVVAVNAAKTFVLSLFANLSAVPSVCAPSRLDAQGIQITTPHQRRVDHSGLRYRGPPLTLVV